MLWQKVTEVAGPPVAPKYVCARPWSARQRPQRAPHPTGEVTIMTDCPRQGTKPKHILARSNLKSINLKYCLYDASYWVLQICVVCIAEKGSPHPDERSSHKANLFYRTVALQLSFYTINRNNKWYKEYQFKSWTPEGKHRIVQNNLCCGPFERFSSSRIKCIQ